jgi:hypothetical protein
MRAIMAGRGTLVAVRSDRDLPFSENLFARLCISFHGEWRNEATSCNAAIHAPTSVLVFAWHFHRASGFSIIPEKRPAGSSSVGC